MTQVVNVNTKNTQTYHGVSGYFSMYNISVTKDQASATNVWVTNNIYNEVVYMAAGSMVMHPLLKSYEFIT